jgi:hypothetical protein
MEYESDWLENEHIDGWTLGGRSLSSADRK